MEKLIQQSPDLTARNVDTIAELFPTVVTETLDDDGKPVRAIDFDLLRQELSDHVVEGPQERYQLNWPGKREALFAANAPISKTLRPVREESVDFDTTKNLFIEGDNLEALKLLQESYLGKVKLIYIDPPYNTGNDFVYKDNFAESTAEYLARSRQADAEGVRLVANTESNGRFHSDWLSMIYPRLKLARNLLTDDGIILVSIDDNELSTLTHVMDEIFGHANHACTFVWKKGGTGKNDSAYAVVEHEYVLAYARDADGGSFGVDIDAQVTTSYNREDSVGKYSLVRLDSKTLGYLKTLDFEILDAEGRTYRPEQPDGRSNVARWRWGREKVEREHSSLVFERGFVYTKNYEKAGARPRSLLVEERFGVTRSGRADAERALGASGVFEFPKPVRLIQHLIGLIADREATVLDFFAGSGTTAHAVLAANARDGGQRRFIMVQLGEAIDPASEAAKAGFSTIAELARDRIRGAGTKIAQDAGLVSASFDTGFRALRVESTNFMDLLRSPDNLAQHQLAGFTDSVKSDRTGEDLLFQVLIDWGLELTPAIQPETVDEQQIFVVEDGALIVCFADDVSSTVVSSIAVRKPLRAVFRDSAFGNDADRINAEQIFAERSPATDVKTI